MTRRLDRSRRLARTARQTEDVAAAELRRANLELRRADDSYRQLLERSAELAAIPMTAGLRGLLVSTGARAQAARAADRAEWLAEADQRRQRWEEARTRTRSMEKLVERAVRERDERRRVAELAELADVIAARAVAGVEAS